MFYPLAGRSWCFHTQSSSSCPWGPTLSSSYLHQTDKIRKSASLLLNQAYDGLKRSAMLWYCTSSLDFLFVFIWWEGGKNENIVLYIFTAFHICHTAAMFKHPLIWIVLLPSWQRKREKERQWNYSPCCWVIRDILKTHPANAVASKSGIGWLDVLCNADALKLAEEWQVGITT